MVRVLRRAVMACLVLLALDSCQVLFVGVFPASASQITARADLSASIAAAPASYFGVSVVNALGTEYAVLYSTYPFASSQKRLYFLDAGLNVLSSWSNDDVTLAGWPALSGSAAMTDVNGAPAIGGLSWSPLVVPPVPSFPIGPPSVDAPAVTTNLDNASGFNTGGGTLSYTLWNSAWGTPAPDTPALGGPSSSLFVISAFSDPNPGVANVILVFQDNNQQSYFLSVSKADIELPITSVPGFTNMFSWYPTVATKSNLDRNSIAVSRSGVVAYDQQARALIRFPLNDPGKVSSMAFNWKSGMKLAASVSGSYCVVWDPSNRTLTRYDQWW
jgi:hypothetical protein